MVPHPPKRVKVSDSSCLSHFVVNIYTGQPQNQMDNFQESAPGRFHDFCQGSLHVACPARLPPVSRTHDRRVTALSSSSLTSCHPCLDTKTPWREQSSDVTEPLGFTPTCFHLFIWTTVRDAISAPNEWSSLSIPGLEPPMHAAVLPIKWRNICT